MGSEIANPLVAAVGALGAAIAYLFRLVIKQGETHVELSARIGKLEGEHDAIEKLSAATLETVKRTMEEIAERNEQ